MTKNIADISLSFKEVDTKLDKLKSNKSPGIDNIPSRLTKLAQPALIQPLYYSSILWKRRILAHERQHA